jgi:elongation factor Ts
MEVKISAADVKKLRDTTGAGMMDCKKALVEAGGDFEQAIDLLRKKGQKLSAKRADRHAKEGVVVAQVNSAQNKGVIIKLSCETDFVAKNQDFIDLAESIAEMALKAFPKTKEELLDMDFGGISLGDKITEQIGVIGEKVELASYERLEATSIAPYIHMGYRAGVLVGLNVDGDDAVSAGKNVAMQIAAMRPVAVDKDGVDPTVIEREIEIGKEQARQEGKPEAMIEKIALGKLNKFFKESTLLSQAYVKDSKNSVENYLRSVNPELTVTDFRHIELG